MVCLEWLLLNEEADLIKQRERGGKRESEWERERDAETERQRNTKKKTMISYSNTLRKKIQLALDKVFIVFSRKNGASESSILFNKGATYSFLCMWSEGCSAQGCSVLIHAQWSSSQRHRFQATQQSDLKRYHNFNMNVVSTLHVKIPLCIVVYDGNEDMLGSLSPHILNWSRLILVRSPSVGIYSISQFKTMTKT